MIADDCLRRVDPSQEAVTIEWSHRRLFVNRKALDNADQICDLSAWPTVRLTFRDQGFPFRRFDWSAVLGKLNPSLRYLSVLKLDYLYITKSDLLRLLEACPLLTSLDCNEIVLDESISIGNDLLPRTSNLNRLRITMCVDVQYDETTSAALLQHHKSKTPWISVFYSLYGLDSLEETQYLVSLGEATKNSGEITLVRVTNNGGDNNGNDKLLFSHHSVQVIETPQNPWMASAIAYILALWILLIWFLFTDASASVVIPLYLLPLLLVFVRESLTVTAHSRATVLMLRFCRPLYHGLCSLTKRVSQKFWFVRCNE
uniref:F-box/LRR-repeat protein n=1 Tax=Panagrellus redivivus TaxID=6233 RepID=A0A7E4UZN0_PANRE